MKHPFKTGSCKGCGRSVVFARDEKGTLVPLDPTPALYFVHEDPAATPALKCERIQSHQLADHDGPPPTAYPMVIHFATCPKASAMSRRNKTGELELS